MRPLRNVHFPKTEIPSDLAYGDNPTRASAPAGDLVFDVDLLEILGP